MKKLLNVVLLTTSFFASAQVGVNTTNPDASAELEVRSTTKGFLPPRMTEVQMNAINNPAEGLMVFCTDCDPKGLYVNIDNGSEFVSANTGAASGAGGGEQIGTSATTVSRGRVFDAFNETYSTDYMLFSYLVSEINPNGKYFYTVRTCSNEYIIPNPALIIASDRNISFNFNYNYTIEVESSPGNNFYVSSGSVYAADGSHEAAITKVKISKPAWDAITQNVTPVTRYSVNAIFIYPSKTAVGQKSGPYCELRHQVDSFTVNGFFSEFDPIGSQKKYRIRENGIIILEGILTKK